MANTDNNDLAKRVQELFLVMVHFREKAYVVVATNKPHAFLTARICDSFEAVRKVIICVTGGVWQQLQLTVKVCQLCVTTYYDVNIHANEFFLSRKAGTWRQ